MLQFTKNFLADSENLQRDSFELSKREFRIKEFFFKGAILLFPHDHVGPKGKIELRSR
jgi:hypothetical protein